MKTGTFKNISYSLRLNANKIRYDAKEILKLLDLETFKN